MGDELDELLGLRPSTASLSSASGRSGSGGAGRDGTVDGHAEDEGSEDERADGLVGPPQRTATDLVWVHPASIRPNQFQPREFFDEEDLTALATSIGAVGVLQPLLVRRIDDNQYELIAGERRWRAAQRAGAIEVPVLVRDTDDQGSLQEAVVENLHRQDLTAVEEAAAYRQLMDDFGLTQDEVARRVGKSRSAVANTLRLLHLTAEVQRLIATRQLSAGHARALLGVGDRGVQLELAGRVISEELSVRQTEEIVRRTVRDGGTTGSQSSRGPGAGHAALREIEQLLGEQLSTRVQVSMAKGRGRLVIEFADIDDLDRIYRELS